MKYSSVKLLLFNKIHYILQTLQAHVFYAVQIIINGGFKAAKRSAKIVKKPYMYLTPWHMYSASLNIYFPIR